MIKEKCGIEKTLYLALLHAQRALEYIDKINSNK